MPQSIPCSSLKCQSHTTCTNVYSFFGRFCFSVVINSVQLKVRLFNNVLLTLNIFKHLGSFINHGSSLTNLFFSWAHFSFLPSFRPYFSTNPTFEKTTQNPASYLNSRTCALRCPSWRFTDSSGMQIIQGPPWALN